MEAGKEIAYNIARHAREKMVHVQYGVLVGIAIMLIYWALFWMRRRNANTCERKLSIIASLNRLHEDPSVKNGHITQQYFYT